MNVSDKVSLDNLKTYLIDALSSDTVTPQEILNALKDAVRETQSYHRESLQRADKMLSLLEDRLVFDLNPNPGFSFTEDVIDPAGNNLTRDSLNRGIWEKPPIFGEWRGEEIFPPSLQTES